MEIDVSRLQDVTWWYWVVGAVILAVHAYWLGFSVGRARGRRHN